jgi:hypothetical protein
MAGPSMERLGEVRISELLDKATALKLDGPTAQMYVAGSILEHLGRLKQSFSYRQPLSPSDSPAASTFERSFDHVDWVDGESAVQAGETPSEEGFNARFHAIETDIDNLAKEIARGLEEQAKLRAQLATMFEDIRSALNRLGSRVPDEVIIPPRVFEPKFESPYAFPVNPIDPVGPFGPLRQPQILERPDRPGEGFAFGKPARKLARQRFAGQDVDVWSTEAGMMLLPVAAQPDAPGSLPTGIDPGLERAGLVNSYLTENKDRLSEKLGDGAFSIADVKTHFGTETLADGTKLEDVLTDLPTGTSVDNVEKLSELIIDRQVDDLASSGRQLEALVGAVGLVTGDKPAEDAPINRLSVVSEAESKALSAAGIKTVADLSAATPSNVASVLTNAGFAANETSAARLVGIGRGVGRLGRIR